MKNYGNRTEIVLKEGGLIYIIHPWGKAHHQNHYEWKVYRVEGEDWVFCGHIRNPNPRLSYRKLFHYAKQL